MELLFRFCIGGLVVSGFALLGDLFKPKSFAGLFGAAPSVALATLSLTVSKQGTEYAATEARSMILGAIALLIYCQVVSWILMHKKWSSLPVTLCSMVIWLASAFALLGVLIR